MAQMANNPAGQQLMAMLQQNMAAAQVGAGGAPANYANATTASSGQPIQATVVGVVSDNSTVNYNNAPAQKSKWEQEAEMEGGAASDMFAELEKPIGQE